MDIERVKFSPTETTELKGPNEGGEEAHRWKGVMDWPENRPYYPDSRGWHVTQSHANGCKAGEDLVH